MTPSSVMYQLCVLGVGVGEITQAHLGQIKQGRSHPGAISLPVIDTVNQSRHHSRLVSDTPLRPFNHVHYHPGADSPMERQFATLLPALSMGVLGDGRVNKIRQVHK